MGLIYLRPLGENFQICCLFRAIKRLGMWYRGSKVDTLSFIKYHSVYCQLYVINFHGIHAFSLSYSSVSVISYGYKLVHFVEDFYELSIILISYELELNPGIRSNPADQRKC